MKIPYYQIDAFTTEKSFSGNPAGVCILQEWLSDKLLQNIAFENNLSETAFIIERKEHFELRWFTPNLEMDLCGHATLAPAYLILKRLSPEKNEITFKSKSGDLIARKNEDLIEINFPSRTPTECSIPEGLIESIGLKPQKILKSRDYLLLYENENEILSLKPNFKLLEDVDCFAVIATAKGDNCDFVSRFFAPSAAVPEDPVTGSAHSTLIPYWADQLNKSELHAFQLSQRGGELFCKNLKKRVQMSGNCRIYFEGFISI